MEFKYNIQGNSMKKQFNKSNKSSKKQINKSHINIRKLDYSKGFTKKMSF